MNPFQSALVTGGTGFIGSALVQRLVLDRIRAKGNEGDRSPPGGSGL